MSAAKFIPFLLERAAPSLTSLPKGSTSDKKSSVSCHKGSSRGACGLLGWGGRQDWYPWDGRRCVRTVEGRFPSPRRWGFEEQ